jgi:DNA adenine methylase
LGDAGRGVALAEYFAALSARLERVRVMCGDWARVTSPTVTVHNGLTGMFLDPPYLDNCAATYNYNDDVRVAVRGYALAHGDEMRIALCGYEGEHVMPDSWECVAWKTKGGYGSQGNGAGRENCKRERIWFSPACLKEYDDLFATAEN